MFALVTLPTYRRKPHLFPRLPLLLRDNLEAYSTELKDLAMKILDQMANALRMESSDMRCIFEEGIQAMRMNYYPPCPQPELANGINAHSDAGSLTILLQLNEMQGLQIVTNGIYRSIEHPGTLNSEKEKERLSIATFLSPKLEGDFGRCQAL